MLHYPFSDVSLWYLKAAVFVSSMRPFSSGIHVVWLTLNTNIDEDDNLLADISS